MRVNPNMPKHGDQVPTGKLQVQPGRHIRGKVLQELGRGQWLVRVQGQELVVESSVRLEPGAIIHAEVLEAGTPIKIRLLPQPSEASVPSAASATRLLSEMGLQANRENTALLQTITQLGWSPSLLESLIPYMQALPGQTPMNAVLAWLMGFPPHPHLLESLHSLTQAHTPLGQLLDQLQSEMHTFLQNNPSDALQQKWQALQRWLPPSPGENLMEWLQQLNTSYESQLLRASGVQEHMKALLLEMQMSLHEMTADGKQAPNRIIEQILHQLDAHAMVNQKPVEFLPAFYFQIPYPLDGHRGTIEFKGEPSPDDEEGFQITFVAHTVNLGKLKVVLQLAGREVSCTLLAESNDTRDFVHRHESALRSGLEALEYRVRQIRSSVASPEAFVLEIIHTVPASLEEISRLDMRV